MPPSPSTPPALLIALPHGLAISGITTWAVRLADAFAAMGRRVTLIAHEIEGHPARAALTPISGVEVVTVRTPRSLDEAGGDYRDSMPTYRDTLRRLFRETGRPVVVAPNLTSECYGIVASLAAVEPELFRVAAWCHNHIEHDFQILRHFAPAIHRFVGVSRAVADQLRARIAGREADVVYLPHGVAVPATCPVREPLRGRAARLIYTGRIDETQKRTGALVAMSESLAVAGIEHELMLVGDGPAAADIDRRIIGSSRVRRVASAPPSEIARLLARADFFVMASRYEGFSIAMVEAMAQGCIPVVTRVESGAADAVEPGVTGELIEASIGDEALLGTAMAEGVRRALSAGPDRLSDGCWRRTREAFSIERHASLCADLFDSLVSDDPRWWVGGGGRTAASQADGMAGFSVPAEAPARMRAALRELAGRRVALWGAGRHTIAVAAELATSPASILAIIDDDPARAGSSLLGYPIVRGAQLAGLGVTDVVISSWMHESDMWSRRGALESMNVRVHRLYVRS
ncbi:MAG TPA: glycosyltransferase [Phycisphaerales bacterium]|nr:glycosyltransferase [Phycisphaerales bacterium]